MTRLVPTSTSESWQLYASVLWDRFARTADIGADKLGADKLGADEIEADEIGADEIGADEVGADEIGADRASIHDRHRPVYH